MIEVLHLFPTLNSLLIGLLKELPASKWNTPTVCKKWSVKDVAAHLLDTALRRLSIGRDSYSGVSPEVRSYEELLAFLNSLNAEWVKACKRLSPEVLVELLEVAQDRFYGYMQTLDPLGAALFPVSWAGEEQSRMWFDIAREYTERWHHQQQIRLAVGAESILSRELYHPFLKISMLALPFHYKQKAAQQGSVVRINVVGEAGGAWSISCKDDVWQFTEADSAAATEVYIDQNIAWLLLSNGIDIMEAEQYWQISGNYELGFHALKMKAFMV